MIKAHSYKVIVLLAAIVLQVSLTSCAKPNKPNVPVTGPINELEYITGNNTELANEIKKLPEIQDGIDLDDRAGLNTLSSFYKENEAAFNIAFSEMKNVGLPDYRKYCSPLQAIFWLAMRDQLSAMEESINPFNLEYLLDRAWVYAPVFGSASSSKIIDSCNDPEMREKLRKRVNENPELASEIIINEVTTSPEKFADWAIQLVERNYKKHKWSNFDEVLDRLNSPELVHYYVLNQITYQYYWYIKDYKYYSGDARYVFNNKKGECMYISEFIAKALRTNGYRAWMEKKPPIGLGNWHAVCAFEDKGKKYIIDDGKHHPTKKILRYDEYNPYPNDI